MKTRSRESFTTIHTEGGLLPPDLLARLVSDRKSLDGLAPESYHLAASERLNEAASRAWSRLIGAWTSFRTLRAALPENDAGTTLTRERWLLILFQELGYGRLLASKGREIDGKSYPISHFWGQVPIHLVGSRVDLDRRTSGVAGAARSSPHSLVQEYLNRTPAALWGFVANGLELRVLRDNSSLVRQAYVAFDLEAMMDGEVYADFVVLWLICHQSRVEAEQPEDCWLERWASTAREQGTRALEALRVGVETAIQSLGRGFLGHAANRELRERLRSGALDPQDYYRELLRLVYRLLFLFVAEDRDLLASDGASAPARDRYARFYSTARLRRLAQETRGTRHGDLWRMLSLVMEKLGSDEGCEALALPALGSFLWSKTAVPHVAACEIENHHVLDALRALAFTEHDHLLRAVDYKNLGSEELGSLYESLLELHPRIDTDAATFELDTGGGHERKTSGSYYTPPSLVHCLLESALDPVLAEAAAARDPERAILSLKVCDPACGSGHFLVAAAHRIAKRLAAIRTGEDEPAPQATRKALRDVINRCLHGVDVNPMAVELCKVSLWMEALEPGKPLSFLEHRIVCGNSLMGATPALLAQGILDEAFEPIEGDDKVIIKELRKRNRDERKGQRTLYTAMVADFTSSYGSLASTVHELDAIASDSIDQIHEKERRYQGLARSNEFRAARLLADAWCASFVWKKTKAAPPPVTHEVFLRLRKDAAAIVPALRDEIGRLADQYRFFHWHLAFPEVFRVPKPGEEAENERTGWSGGFDVVLGNPPWEHTELKEKEFFATSRPDVANAGKGATRKEKIRALAEDDPALLGAFQAAKREHDSIAHFLGNSGRFPLCGRGRINTYAVFAETMRMLLSPRGRVGAIVPSGIATDDTTKAFFGALIDQRLLVSLYSFENEEFIFPAVHHATKFCLLTIAGTASSADPQFAFFARHARELRDPKRAFTLSSSDIALLNPNTHTCPVFRSKRDAEITKAIYRRVPVLLKEGPPEENPWGVSFKQGLFNMTSASEIFRTCEQLEAKGWTLEGNIFSKGRERYLPLYEAKMIHHFDHRFGSYTGQTEAQANQGKLPELNDQQHADPEFCVMPRYWVPESEVDDRLAGKLDRGWLLGWRDICRNTDERTVIASALPRLGVGHTLPLMLFRTSDISVGCLLANLTSFVLDYAARQKVGGTHLTYGYLNQLPVLAPVAYSTSTPWYGTLRLEDWFRSRIYELTHTSHELAAFARDLGYSGHPFRWDDGRRFLLRCELDAAFFHLYGISRDDADYILDTFPIVRRDDERSHGEYRTKRVILECYDAMQKAMDSGKAYATILKPPPADPSVAHAERVVTKAT